MGVPRAGGALGEERGARAAHALAVAVLRVRGRALAVALLPAAVAVVLLTGGATGRLAGGGWDVARWVVSGLAAAVLLGAAAVGTVIARARPALTPTVEITEASAPDLYRLVRDLASRLSVPAPSAIALTPDCDSWLEDRTHRAHRVPGRPHGPSDATPVLVIGSPFLWWMRVGELRAVLAPVVAGTGASADPDIAAARRFVRGLDAAVALPDRPGLGALPRLGARGVGAVARLLLRAVRGPATEMERAVATAASERAQAVDYGLRIVAQEQVGLAYAGWDRLLTRVALPAWRMGRWPSRLDAGVVSALTELSRRDRLAEGYTTRLGERPACDLLEEPGLVDEATSLLAARLFHGGPAVPGADWAPVDWQRYPDEVVDRKWRTEAARLHRALDRLDGLGAHPGDPDGTSEGPTLARVLRHLSTADDGDTLAAAISAELSREESALLREDSTRRPPSADPSSVRPSPDGLPSDEPSSDGLPSDGLPSDGPSPGSPSSDGPATHRPTTGAAPDPAPGGRAGTAGATPGPAATAGPAAPGPAAASDPATAPDPAAHVTGGPAAQDPAAGTAPEPTGHGQAATRSGQVVASAHSGSASETARAGDATGPAPYIWGGDDLPLLPLQPPRTDRELLADHVTAMVCCAAVDTAGAAPGLDWLDGPVLLLGEEGGRQRADVADGVLALIEDADPEPLRSWLTAVGARPEKPVRLV
ncbi:hypothetical protein [Streptomyces sp. DH12]|uniref:hypothetical protein n=1 Tax=Streptomyces sp. DH12 TaxID=2857010 RepID=UPI001E28D2AE|nr:hypothetical protein [Streptomyces sp. DH12]